MYDFCQMILIGWKILIKLIEQFRNCLKTKTQAEANFDENSPKRLIFTNFIQVWYVFRT